VERRISKFVIRFFPDNNALIIEFTEKNFPVFSSVAGINPGKGAE
jgi:hypothetical protein